MHCIVTVIATICLLISTMAKEFNSIEDNKKHDIKAINVLAITAFFSSEYGQYGAGICLSRL